MLPSAERWFVSASVKAAWSRPQRVLGHVKMRRVGCLPHRMVRLRDNYRQKDEKASVLCLGCGATRGRHTTGEGIFNIQESDFGRTNKHGKYTCFSPTNHIVKAWLFYLRRWGQERFDVDIGVMHLQVVVSQSSGHPNCCHNPSLEIKKWDQNLLRALCQHGKR